MLMEGGTVVASLDVTSIYLGDTLNQYETAGHNIVMCRINGE